VVFRRCASRLASFNRLSSSRTVVLICLSIWLICLYVKRHLSWPVDRRASTALILARVFGNSRVNGQQAARKSHRELGHEPDLEARAPLITLAATTPQIDITLNQH
jgi:hypothetical protein